MSKGMQYCCSECGADYPDTDYALKLRELVKERARKCMDNSEYINNEIVGLALLDLVEKSEESKE